METYLLSIVSVFSMWIIVKFKYFTCGEWMNKLTEFDSDIRENTLNTWKLNLINLIKYVLCSFCVQVTCYVINLQIHTILWAFCTCCLRTFTHDHSHLDVLFRISMTHSLTFLRPLSNCPSAVSPPCHH